MNGVNPNFPTIHITTHAPHNAWLQIIRTDNEQEQFKVFIDTFPTPHEWHPFYTKEIDFYDAPLWSATYYHKYVTYWQAHTYAVHINEKDKTITCIGGVKWGYLMKHGSWGPEAIIPSGLNHNQWNIDKTFFNNELKQYTWI